MMEFRLKAKIPNEAYADFVHDLDHVGEVVLEYGAYTIVLSRYERDEI